MTTLKMTYREAVRAALLEALQKYKEVFLNTPLSESTFVGAGIGAIHGAFLVKLFKSPTTETH